MKNDTLPVKHIGVPLALCDERIVAYLRDDLESSRYRQLGVKERFKNEPPYRVCKRCIRKIEAKELRLYGRLV
jgi:hypothetical protein